jgi:hypothetical protein
MSDHDVGILLGLDPTHVERLKHGIRSALRRPILRRLVGGDLYYRPDALSTDEHELLCKSGDVPLGWHPPSTPMGTRLRSHIASEFVRRLPQFFGEPLTYHDFREEWKADESGYYTAIPHSFRRNLLVRLIDICAEDMRKHKYLRVAATDHAPREERTAAFPEGRDGFSKRPRIKKTRRRDSKNRSSHSPRDDQPAR